MKHKTLIVNALAFRLLIDFIRVSENGESGEVFVVNEN